MRALIALAAAVVALGQASPQPPATLTVVNPLDLARPAETITVAAADLLAVVPVKDLRAIHVRDAQTGADLLTQAIDLDDNGTFDELIFQANLAAKESRTFAVTAGERRVPKPSEFRAYGRFVRERRDDFAWENDLVAHRMYGAALETWAQEPLTSSAIDVWVKKTPRLIINDWYMVDDYHRDTGEGADFYSAGTTRGCGGSGVWLNDTLSVSKNFRGSRVLANGPIRVMFELSYEPWAVGGAEVAETKRIALDAGHYLNHIESTYRPWPAQARVGIGIRANPGALVASDDKAGILRVWEPIQNKAAENGWMGCAIVLDSADRTLRLPKPVDGNHLALASAAGGHIWYLAGSAWDRGGAIRDASAWDAYLAAEAARLRSPVRASLGR